MSLLFITLFLRSLLNRKKNVPHKLFKAALLHENNGHYDEALTHYNDALIEMKKERRHGTLKASIIDKIKTLHTVIKYQKQFSTALAVPVQGNACTIKIKI